MADRPRVITSHTNTEGEKATMEVVTAGPFAGRLVLVIWDDPPLCSRAPMLLDDGTADWLRAALAIRLIKDGQDVQPAPGFKWCPDCNGDGTITTMSTGPDLDESSRECGQCIEGVVPVG